MFVTPYHPEEILYIPKKKTLPGRGLCTMLVRPTGTGHNFVVTWNIAGDEAPSNIKIFIWNP